MKERIDEQYYSVIFQNFRYRITLKTPHRISYFKNLKTQRMSHMNLEFEQKNYFIKKSIELLKKFEQNFGWKFFQKEFDENL